jgi:hypothetical protein
MEMPELIRFAKYIIETFHNDPLGYCRAILEFEPDEWQKEVLESVRDNRRTAVRSGHGVGKTRLASSLIHWFMSTRAYPRIRCTADTEKQIMSVLWAELGTINRVAKNREMFDYNRTSFRLVSAPETHFAEAIAWSAENSEAFAGIHADNVLYIFDEASAIDESIWEVSQGAMTGEGARWLVLGNPTRNTGRFNECFGRNKWTEGSDDTSLWHTFTVSSEQSPRVDKSYINEIIREYGKDSDMFRVRVLGLPPMQSSQQFISIDLFEESVNRTAFSYPQDAKVLGVDPARFGDDSTAIVERKGKVATIKKVLHGQDTMGITGQVIALIAEAKKSEPYDYICVDEIGVGAGVVDRLREQNFDVIAVNVTEKPRREDCKNMTSELWLLIKEWLKTGKIQEAFRDDLIGRQYSFDSSGRLAMERKEDMKKRGLRSPDLADALALTFYPLNPIKKTMQTPPRKDQSSRPPWARR